MYNDVFFYIFAPNLKTDKVRLKITKKVKLWKQTFRQ